MLVPLSWDLCGDIYFSCGRCPECLVVIIIIIVQCTPQPPSPPSTHTPPIRRETSLPLSCLVLSCPVLSCAGPSCRDGQTEIKRDALSFYSESCCKKWLCVQHSCAAIAETSISRVCLCQDQDWAQSAPVAASCRVLIQLAGPQLPDVVAGKVGVTRNTVMLVLDISVSWWRDQG